MKNHWPTASFDPWVFANHNGHHRHPLPGSLLTRLTDAYPQTSGSQFQVCVEGQAQPVPALHLTLSGILAVPCQRCFAPIPIIVDIDEHYRLCHDPESPPPLSGYEDLCVTDRQLCWLNWFEDEILLAIPLSPRHDKLDDCIAQGYPPPTTTRYNPFMGLKSQKF